MNKLLLCTALLLTACAPGGPVMVDLGDIDDYRDFLEERDEEEAPEVFKPEPLYVSATGKVRAEPDIAVITATISAKDKNESRAVDDMSKIINAVQAALEGQALETGFTGVNSRREFDEACLNANQAARQRQAQIQNDYWFNRRLDQRGDKEIKRRPAKTRIAQQVCEAQLIKVSTQMVLRIQPASAAGDALRALSDAGAEQARLYGYDFTDYDALYQDAASKAVSMARKKAETTARLAGAVLGEIESFSVTRPERTSRFGPQPNVIRPARRFQGQSGSVIDRKVNRRRGPQPPPVNSYAQPQAAMTTCWDGTVVSNGGYCPASPVMDDEIVVTGTRGGAAGYGAAMETVVVQEASTELVSVPATWETVYDNGVARRVVKTPASTVERVIPAVTKQQFRGAATGGQTTNALSMSLLSGPQTISVTANLSYTYDTPLNGKIIMEGEE